MSRQVTFDVREFVPQDLGQVLDLFADGLIEFAGKNEQGVRRYIDNALKDDMADITIHHQARHGGNFWVADGFRLSCWSRRYTATR